MIIAVCILLAVLEQSNAFFTQRQSISASHRLPSKRYMSLVSSPVSPRIQRIREISLQREILNDISASEFALRVEVKESDKELIDYEKLISKLDRDLEVLQNSDVKFDFGDKLVPRLLAMKEDLLLAINNLPPKNIVLDDPGSTSSLATDVTTSDGKNSDSSDVEKLKKDLTENLRIMVREDGTVDWDGAIASGKQVAKVGTELWERLNGKAEEEGVPSLAELFSPAQAKIPATPEMEQLNKVVGEIRAEIGDVSIARESLRAKLRQDRRDGKPMSATDISALRRLDVKVKELDKRLRIFTLNLDMEKICAYLQQELEASSDPSDQRLLISEVTLIDKQLTTLLSGLQLQNLHGNTGINNFTSTTNEDAWEGVLALIDDGELAYICNTVIDLKTRLGLDTQLMTGVDWGTFGKVATDALSKVKAGLAFFSEGTKLLVADVQYGWLLLIKAVGGYTLKAREVNALRRTGKDLLTLIPFTIILIIPLSPVGHVLVFSFIQRFFPEFYPSCYTEKRLNLRKLFAEVERKREDELVDIGTDSTFTEWSAKVSKLGTWLTTKATGSSNNISSNSS